MTWRIYCCLILKLLISSYCMFLPSPGFSVLALRALWLPLLLFCLWAWGHLREYSQIFTANSTIKWQWCCWRFLSFGVWPLISCFSLLCFFKHISPTLICISTLLLLPSSDKDLFFSLCSVLAGSWYIFCFSFGGVIEVREPSELL